MGYREKNVSSLLARSNILHVLVLLCCLLPLTLTRTVFYSHFVNHWKKVVLYWEQCQTHLEKMLTVFSENCLTVLVFFFCFLFFYNLSMPPYWRNVTQTQTWIWYLIANPVLQFLALGMNISTFFQSTSSPKESGIQLSPQNHQCWCDLPEDINSVIIPLIRTKYFWVEKQN